MVMQIANSQYAFACRMDNVKEAAMGNKVSSGCAVTANSPADMYVDIASGVVRINGLNVTVSAVSNQAINAANGTHDRWDSLSVGSNGTVDYTAGTAAANPMPPDLATEHILLALVFVENNSTTVETADILDSRLIDAEGIKMKYVGSDVYGEIDNSSNETTIATITIPANTVVTRIIIIAPIETANSSGGSRTGTFKLKAGATGSEGILDTKVLTSNGVTYTARKDIFVWADTTALNYTVENTVLITGQNETATVGVTCKCNQLVVTGY